MAVSLEFWQLSQLLGDDFQGPLENEVRRHFRMFSSFTPYGGFAHKLHIISIIFVQLGFLHKNHQV